MIASPASRLHNTNHTDALSAQRENLNTNIQRSVVMDEHLELGRCCYKRGEFIEAAEAFGRAIIRAPSVQLYDNRAACREKLNDLPNALKDAQAAIQLQRVDPRGYLRAGEILVKMHKERNALDVYRLALQIIKHVGKGYEVRPFQSQKLVAYLLIALRDSSKLTAISRSSCPLATALIRSLSCPWKSQPTSSNICPSNSSSMPAGFQNRGVRSSEGIHSSGTIWISR